jgi:hypothetical protein
LPGGEKGVPVAKGLRLEGGTEAGCGVVDEGGGGDRGGGLLVAHPLLLFHKRS